MDPCSRTAMLSPSNNSRPYQTTFAHSDDLSLVDQQHDRSVGARPMMHHPMDPRSGGIGASGSNDERLSMLAASRHYGTGFGLDGLRGPAGPTEPGEDTTEELRGQHRPGSSSYRSHDLTQGQAHRHQQQQHVQPPPLYQHAYSGPTFSRTPARLSNPNSSPQPPPSRKTLPMSTSTTRLPLHKGVTPTLQVFASPFSPIDRFHPSPYAATVSSGPSPAQSAPRSAGLHDFHSVRGVTQTPNWHTQASYTPNSVFSSYPNTPAGVGESGGGDGSGGNGIGSGGMVADPGHLSTSAGPTPTQAYHEHRGQLIDGNGDQEDEDYEFVGIPPGHVPVDAWGPQGPPAHVREMMRKRPLFEGGKVQPASPQKQYLQATRSTMDADRPHRPVPMETLRSPMGATARGVGSASLKTANVGVGSGVLTSPGTSDWTTSEHNEFDSQSVTKGPSGTVRRAFTSTTHTVTHHHHHHHRPEDVQEDHLQVPAPPSVGGGSGSSTVANAATTDPMDVGSPTGGEWHHQRHQQPPRQRQQHQSDVDASEDDWSECKTTVTHTTTTRRAPAHQHQHHAQAPVQHHDQEHGNTLASPYAVVEDSIPVAKDDEKHSLRFPAEPNPHTYSRERERIRDMPPPSPYYEGAIPPPPPSHAYHAPSSSATGRRSGQGTPPGPVGVDSSNSASVYFGNRRSGYFDDGRTAPPPGPGMASRAYWSDRERMTLMMDRDRSDRDRYFRGYPPAPGAHYLSSYPPPPTLQPPRGGQYDLEVRHMTADYPPRMPPLASVLPPLDEYERRIWSMSKRRDSLGDVANERDRVRHDMLPPPPVDARAAGYRLQMPLNSRARYWGGSPHEVYSSTSTRFHHHPSGYYRSYEEVMYQQRERECSAAMMDRARAGAGGYDRMERGNMPTAPGMHMGPSLPVMGLNRGELSEWSAPRASDAQSEGPPPYDVGSWQEQKLRESPQRVRAGGRAASHLPGGGAHGPPDSGHFSLRPERWRHSSRVPPIDTRSMSAGSQTAHASASASPPRHGNNSSEHIGHPHEQPPINSSSAGRRLHPQTEPPQAVQAPPPSASAPVSQSNPFPDTPLQLGPNMGTTAVGLAIMAAIDEGDIGKRRDYLTFTRATYVEMIECLRRPNEPLGPHITDRRRWKRLMNLLVEHPGQPTYQSLTWKQCPLWIVPHEDWDQLIWEHHYSNGQPGVAECNTVAKTARMLGRLYQTRRSRCGIFIEYIAQLLSICPHCAGGEEGAKIIGKAKGKLPTYQQLLQVQRSRGGESAEMGAGDQRSAAPASIGTETSQPTGSGVYSVALQSPHTPLEYQQQQQQPFALVPDSIRDQQAPSVSSHPEPAHASLPFSYLPGLPLDPAAIESDQGQHQHGSGSTTAVRDASGSPPSSGTSQRMLVDGESDGEIGSQQHDPLFSDPPPDPHVVFQDRR